MQNINCSVGEVMSIAKRVSACEQWCCMIERACMGSFVAKQVGDKQQCIAVCACIVFGE